jgi:hypothetical protein
MTQVLVSAGVRNAGDPDGRCANAVRCRTLRRAARPDGVVERGGTSRAGVTGWAPRFLDDGVHRYISPGCVTDLLGLEEGLTLTAHHVIKL